MAVDEYALTSVRDIDQALARLPNGAALLAAARTLGLWTAAAHTAVPPRRPFPASLAQLTAAQLSDEHGHWLAELGRLTELAGALDGLAGLLATRAKRERALARARARRTAPEGQRATVAAVDDAAEADPAVRTVDDQLAYVALLQAQTRAARDATAAYVHGLSREITARGDQLRAGI